ncbi:MAG: hypothetical protein WC813_03265 [Patescibacteria group bacterium]|jgi:hypothetical protein
MIDRRLRPVFGLGVFFLLAGVLAFVFRPTAVVAPEVESVHYHAGFQIYVDDVLQDFSAMEYMELAPCDVGSNKTDDEKDETLDLHNGVGDVVHVHRAGTTWKNLVEYLQTHQQFAPENLSEKGIYGYVNGKKINDIREYPIAAYDSVVLIIGYELGDVQDKLNKAVTVNAIKKAENQKENCGS